MSNYRVVFSYNGSHFNGFQAQVKGKTVEGELRKALRSLYCCDIKINSSGRTDSGVHAYGHVISYITSKVYSTCKIKNALNSYLHDDIYIREVEDVDFHFNARFSAISREYRYLFSTCQIPFFLKDRVVGVKFEIDESKFDFVTQQFIGKKDFVNFRKSGSNEKSTIREIYAFEINKVFYNDLYTGIEDIVLYEVKIIANSFLYRMVRNIVGCVFEVLRNKYMISDIKHMFIDKVNKNIKYTAAPSKGLCLFRVNY